MAFFNIGVVFFMWCYVVCGVVLNELFVCFKWVIFIIIIKNIFRCKQCVKSYTHPSSLRKHQATHCGNRGDGVGLNA